MSSVLLGELKQLKQLKRLKRLLALRDLEINVLTWNVCVILPLLKRLILHVWPSYP